MRDRRAQTAEPCDSTRQEEGVLTDTSDLPDCPRGLICLLKEGPNNS